MFYYRMGGNGSLGFKVENLGDLFSFNFFLSISLKNHPKNFWTALCPFQTM
jgi:hypothetical protein